MERLNYLVNSYSPSSGSANKCMKTPIKEFNEWVKNPTFLTCYYKNGNWNNYRIPNFVEWFPWYESVDDDS